MKRKLICFVICALLLVTAGSCDVKREKVDFSYFSGNFNPFSAISHTDLSAAALTQSYLLVKVPDEDDESESQIKYNAYSAGLGIADIAVAKSEDGGAEYTIKLGDDIKFSDGSPVTAKDVAFSLYVYCDMDYIGWASAYTADIDGLTEYRYNNSLAGEIDVTDEQISKELASPSDSTKNYIREQIIEPVLREEYQWVQHLYTDPAYDGTEAEQLTVQYPDAKDLFTYYYALDDNYSAASDEERLISDIADQFGTDYKLLGDIYGSDLSSRAKECARRTIIESALEQSGGEPVDNIRGINIVDDKTVTLKINSTSLTQLENALGVFVAPFDVYGKNCSFNGDGFTINIDSVLDPSLEPVGAGPCVFDGYKKGEGVRLSENKHYYKEADFEQNVLLVETGDSLTEQADDYFTVYEERLIVSE